MRRPRAVLLWRVGLRGWQRHPGQAGLSVLGVALGVAVAVAVSVANDSAREAFRLSVEAVSGTATHQIIGGSAGVPEQLYVTLRLQEGFRQVAPIVEDFVSLVERPGRQLHVLGIDPFAEMGLRGRFGIPTGRTQQPGEAIPVAGLIGREASVLLSRYMAAQLGVAIGDSVTVQADGRRFELRLIGLVGSLEPGPLAEVAWVDISTAQELSGSFGRLSRIDLRLRPERADSLRALLPPSVRLVDAQARSQATLQLTGAFRLNLTAMSLLALLCGGFLIHNTMAFAVLRRRGLIGSLRALGVTRGQVFTMVCVEATAIGLVGSAAGIPLGVGLASGLVRLVTRTINDLYFTVRVTHLHLPWWIVGAGLVLGVATTLLAALTPAWEATRIPPRAAMTRSSVESAWRRRLPAVTAGGIVLLAVGAFGVGRLHAVPAIFGALSLALLGAALVVPAMTLALTYLLRPLVRAVGGALGNLAIRGLSANLSRVGVAVAALSVALSVVVGVGVMVDSFRLTLQRWLAYTLAADLYVAPATGSRSGGDLAFDEALRGQLLELSSVAAVHTLRRASLELDSGPAALLVVDSDGTTASRYRLKQRLPGAWDRFARGAVLVSEPFAMHRGIESGSVLHLPTPSGSEPFVVAGVFFSYASDRGVILMARKTYLQHWHDPGFSGISIVATDDAPPALERLGVQIRAMFLGRGQRVTVVSNRQLRARSLAVFDRTFRITEVLRLLVMVVALVSVLSALMAIQLERSREFGVLRATGLLRRQLATLVTAQTGLLGLIAAILSIPAGLALAWVMVFVINRRAFGWTLQMRIDASLIGQALAVGIVAAVAAGVIPAWRIARAVPARALRQE